MAAARRPQSSAAALTSYTGGNTVRHTQHPTLIYLDTVNISHYYSATSIYVQNVPIANCVLFLYSYTIALGRWHEVRSPPRGGAAQILITPSRCLHCPMCPLCPLCPVCPVCLVCPLCPMCPLSPHCTLGKQSVEKLRKFSKYYNRVLVVSAVSPVVNLVSLKY